MVNGVTRRPLDWEHNGRPAKKDDAGYVMVWEPNHPNKSFGGWQYQHRLVVETVLGRYLTPDEDVHHADGQKDNNDPLNLIPMTPEDHLVITTRDYQEQVRRENKELAEYRRRFGEIRKGAVNQTGESTHAGTPGPSPDEVR